MPWSASAGRSRVFQQPATSPSIWPRAAHGVELLAPGETVDRQRLKAGALFLQQRRHADHEELVEVRRDDGQEFHPFEERMVVVERLVEHTLVEREPAELAVNVQARVAQVDVESGPRRRLLSVIKTASEYAEPHRSRLSFLHRPLRSPMQ